MTAVKSSIRKGVWIHAAALTVSDNHVGANSLDKIDRVFSAGQSNGGDQNYRSAAHHHAQSGQRKANFVGAETVERERDNLAEHHGLLGAGKCAGERRTMCVGSSHGDKELRETCQPQAVTLQLRHLSKHTA